MKYKIKISLAQNNRTLIYKYTSDIQIFCVMVHQTSRALLSNSSPSPFQSKSNGLGVDFVVPLSQQEEQEQEKQEQQQEQPSPKSTTRKYTTDLKFGT